MHGPALEAAVHGAGVVVPPGEEEMTPEKAEAIKQAKALLASLKNRTNRTRFLGFYSFLLFLSI